MKKFLVLLMALMMCLGCFAACTEQPADNEGETLAEAVEYLRSIYKDNAKETPTDYDVVGKIIIGDTTFTVTWTTDNANIAVKESSKAGFYTIDLPAKNDTAVDYKLMATVADADGNTQQISFDRTLPVYDASAIVAKPEEGVAYKFYLVHASLGQTLFANGETDNDKYLKTTTDPKAGLDFYVEADGEGFKFYTTIGGTKMYVKASTVTSEDGKVSKYISYDAAEGTTWIYKSETNGWYATIDGIEYVVGTYGTYNTFSISEGTYLTVENSGVTQFPGGLMLKDVAEAMTPSKGPTIYETPEEIVNAAYELEPNAILSGGHTYTLTGVITEIPSPYDASYGNATVVIVVGDMTDKPIECFRLKGEGVENLEVGDTITVSGQILMYASYNDDGSLKSSKVEFNTGCTLVSSNACAHVEEAVAGKDATCTEAGLTEGKKCTACGEVTVAQEEIPALGHDWSAVLAHDVDNHWTVCTRCDETKDQATHMLGDNSVCTTCGYGCDHADVNAATCTSPATCKDCGANTAPATGHTEETVAAVAPTCKDTGLTEGKKCSVCGEITKAQETVAKTNEHTYDGATDATCNVCGYEREASVTVSAPTADGVYKLFLKQVTTNKLLFATSEISGGKFIVGTTDAKAGLDFRAEAVNGGFKFYTEIDGAKKYLNAYTETASDGKTSKYLGYADTTDAVWSYKTETNAWYVTINGLEYVLGTYNSYDTFSISDSKFMTSENTGVSQFPGNLAVKSVAEAADFADKLGSDSGSTDEPSTGLTPVTPEVGKAYKLAFIQENVGTDIYYFNGEKAATYYMGTSKTKADGVDVYIETTDGGYYLYFMNGSAKKYINMVVNGTHVNGEFQDAATTVYTYDTTLKTFKAVVNDTDYIFGTRNDKEYTTLGPVKASDNPFYAQFIQ